MSTRVHAMAGKDLKIDLLPVNSVVKTSQMQDAVHRGVLDARPLRARLLVLEVEVRIAVRHRPLLRLVEPGSARLDHYGGGQELFDELMGSLGLNVVAFFNSPMPAQPLGWFKEEIKDASQMKGLKYRTVGLAADVLLEMGMSVVQLPGGEIQPAMKSGLIDAAEFNNPTSDRDFGMQDVSKHYHLASFHQSQEFFEITFNKKMYEKLPGELQAILKHASEAENSNFYWHNTKRYAEDLVKLRRPGRQRLPHAGIGDGRAAQGLGHRCRPHLGRGSVLRQSCRQPESVCERGDELSEPQPARLQVGV